MRVNISKGFTYTPEWEGNKKLPEADRITVKFEFVSGADLSAFLAAHGDNKAGYFIDDFCAYVKAIYNLKYVDESGNEQEAGPAEVAGISAFAGLYLELRGQYAKATAIKKKVSAAKK